MQEAQSVEKYDEHMSRLSNGIQYLFPLWASHYTSERAATG